MTFRWFLLENLQKGAARFRFHTIMPMPWSRRLLQKVSLVTPSIQRELWNKWEHFLFLPKLVSLYFDSHKVIWETAEMTTWECRTSWCCSRRWRRHRCSTAFFVLVERGHFWYDSAHSFFLVASSRWWSLSLPLSMSYGDDSAIRQRHRFRTN